MDGMVKNVDRVHASHVLVELTDKTGMYKKAELIGKTADEKRTMGFVPGYPQAGSELCPRVVRVC